MHIRSLTIDSQNINQASKAYVIAEIGHNHQGSIELCEKLIDSAINSGASAAKLQKRDNRKLFTKALYNSVYDSPHSYGRTYGEHREALEFSREQIVHLISYAQSKNFTLFSTAFDERSADLLAESGASAFKVASGDLTNTPLLEHISKLGLPVLVSTGGGTMLDVRRAYDTVMTYNEQLCILQCTSAYPVKSNEVNLNIIHTFMDIFPDVVIGLSDHTPNETTVIAGYALGARVFEKHITLDQMMKGSDHKFSLTPNMLKNMVQQLDYLSLAMGDGVKKFYESEETVLSKMRKSLVAASDLPIGHVLRAQDLICKSPSGGRPPYEKGLFLGQRLQRPLSADDQITEEHIRIR